MKRFTEYLQEGQYDYVRVDLDEFEDVLDELGIKKSGSSFRNDRLEDDNGKTLDVRSALKVLGKKDAVYLITDSGASLMFVLNRSGDLEIDYTEAKGSKLYKDLMDYHRFRT